MSLVSQPANTLDDGGRTGTETVAEERQKLLIKFKDKARSHGIKVTDVKVAKAAKPGRWNDRTPVTWWKANDPRCKSAHDRMIRAVLEKDPSAIWSPELTSRDLRK
jgi:hypothetical protein